MDTRHEIAGLIAAAAGLDADFVESVLEVPPRREMGDFALPCFRLSKQLRKSPQVIAAELHTKFGEHIAEPSFAASVSSCEAVGGYFNIYINRRNYVARALSEIVRAGVAFGGSDAGRGQKIVLEFSSPNIAKPFHIGHLCTTAIGSALEHIFSFLGYETVSVNHIGDWGTQFGKLICAYRYWGDPAALASDTMKELLRVYVRFHKELAERPELDDEARRCFLQLEEGEPAVVAQWQEFRDYSIKEFERIYKRLGISFDSYAGESFYSDKMDEIIALLDEKGLLKESEGARIVDLSEFGLQPCIIVKSDGATIYATRDLAAALYRKRTYDFNRNVYVVGAPQTLHFQQVFAILKLMGYAWSDDCVHVGYGHVRFPDRKMATREGEVVELEEVLDESVKRAAALMDPDRKLDDPQKIAETVGVGALIYTFLKNGREHDIVFKWDELLDLEGDSGPYLQYTCARASSVLRNAGGLPDDADYTLLAADEEFELVDVMNAFPGAVADAAQKYEPSILARHVMSVARAFNKFYHYHNILESPPGLREARLRLCGAARSLLGTGLGLLGIEPLDRM